MENRSKVPIPDGIKSCISRYLSYGWGNSIIISLVRRRFGARVTSRCIDVLRSGCSCSPKCRENCVFRSFE